MRTWPVWGGVSLLLVSISPAFAQAQQASRPPTLPAASAAPMTRVQAIQEEAQQLAKSLRLTPQQALVRAKAGDHLGDHVTRLRERFADRIAGIYGVDDPTLKLVVRLVGTARVPREVFKAGDVDIPIEFEVGAPRTLRDLRAAVASNAAKIDAMVPRSLGHGTDERTGELVIQVPGDTSASQIQDQTQKLSAELGIPVRIENANGVTQKADVRGGYRVDTSTYFCTSGFTVRDTTTNVTAMLTSGHCEGVSRYYNVNQTTIALDPAKPEIEDAHRDLEMHTSGYVERPEFFATDLSNIRTVTGRRLRSSTYAGDNVCHRGHASGYSCGYVQQTDFVPKSTTGGPVCGRDNTIMCAPTWVRVTGGTCGPGDSGGPVFVSTVAVGLFNWVNMSGSTCNWWAYMSLDYLPSPWVVHYGS